MRRHATDLACRTAGLVCSRYVLGVIRGDAQPDPGSFGGERIRAANGNEPIYSIAACTELSNGHLHLIRNQELKSDIVEYYSGILTGERVRSRVTPQLCYDAGVEPYLLELWKILPADDWLAWFYGQSSGIDAVEILDRLRSVSEIPTYLEGCRRCRRLQLTKFAFHKQQADELLEAVRKELAGGSF